MAQLRAPDGTSLAYDVYPPATDQRPPATILWLCGWSDHRTRWQRPAQRLASAGYAVYVLDQRGHGDSGGLRGHLSRFSQLLSDLQAFRRLVRLQQTAPQVLLGHSFGALVVLRYLETQPTDPVAAAVLSSPWISLARPVPILKRIAARPLADLWPSLQLKTGLDPRHLCRDPEVGAAYRANPAVHEVMTPGAWREIQWAQRVVPADAHRLDGGGPLLFLLAGQDRIVNATRAREFADGLHSEVESRWYPEMYHELLLDPEWEHPSADVLEFLARASRP